MGAFPGREPDLFRSKLGGMNTTPQITRPRTPSGPLAEIACVSGLIPFDGPAVGYLLFPWLFFGLLLAGPFACLVVLSNVSLDPLALARDPGQLLRLVLYYVAVVIPFFAGGLLVAGPLMATDLQPAAAGLLDELLAQ